MAVNTFANRVQVAQIIVSELRPDARGHKAAIVDFIKEQLAAHWDQCDDSWNHAADELVGQIHGEPFVGGPQDDEQDLDDDGIPMPRPLPFPNDWPPASECEECGGMGYTIGFNGPQKVRYACETCAGGAK